MTLIFLLVAAVATAGIWFYLHQRKLQERAHLLREAIHNHDMSLRLPVKGLFFGERALQQTLNYLGKDINRLLAQNEVETWQQLTRVLTHEIMNATAPISSISQAFLNDPNIKGSRHEEGIRAIYETSRELSAFVENYRKLTHLQEPELTDIDLMDIISSIRPLHPELTWHVPTGGSYPMKADANMMRHVLTNLIKNAAEAGANTIDIRWDEDIYISNDGSLIPPDIVQEIFVPFFTTKKKGSGIGLPLSRLLMVKQGKELCLADKPIPGYQVTFIIR